MKVTTSFLIIFVTSIFAAFSQDTAYIKGKIKGSDQLDGLPGVSIRSGNSGTASSADGSFILELPAGKHELQISFIGYRSIKESLDLVSGDTLILNKTLELATTELDMVVVSASRTEQRIAEVTVSMEVLQSDFIRDKAAQNFQAALEQVPGVTITDEQISIRGGSGFSYGAGSRVLVLVDDLPLMTADAGDVKWSFLPVELIDKVEVIKGAASSMYGSSALNGVINLRTLKPGDTPSFKMNIYHGIYDKPKRKELQWWDGFNPATVGASFAFAKKAGPMDLVFGGTMLNDDGYRKDESEEKQRISLLTDFRLDKAGRAKVGINGSFQEAKGSLFLFWSDPDSGAYIPADGSVSNYVTRRMTVDPHFDLKTVRYGEHRIRGRFFRTENTNDTNQGSTGDVYFSEYQGSFDLINGLDLTLGGSITRNIVRSELYGDHKSLNDAGFFQLNYKWKRLNLSSGARYEMNKNDSLPRVEKPVYRAGASYRILKHTHIRTSYGQGYRYPSIAERFIRTNVGSLHIYPNDSLVPETGWNAEIGIKQGLKVGQWRGYADVAIFQSEYKEMMEFMFGQYGTFSDPFFGFGFKSVNTEHTRITGLDIGINGQGKIGNVDITTLIGYTYIKPVYVEFDSTIYQFNSSDKNVLKYRYPHSAKFDMEAGFKRFKLGASARYYSFMENVDFIFESEAFALLIPSFKGIKEYREKHNQGDVIIDIRTGFKMSESSTIEFMIENLLNREYMTRPMDVQAMRRFMLQLNVSL